ncbi:zinc finger MYM-type protein 2-like [Saccostrea cucullata]|uniref:zinc finger MYM-type protein 2-like n=1 Tax=Saccostrea cuccullata TaxID=36930 RepID=UPI002ED51CB1
MCGVTDEDIELSQVFDAVAEENAISEGLCEVLNLNGVENMDSEIGTAFGSFNLDTVDPVADISDAKPRPVKSEPGDDNSERFGKPVTDDEISKLIASNENVNTKKNTTWALKVFEEWREKRNGNSVDEIPFLHLMTAEQLNFYLGRFIVETRRKDGIEYLPRSLYLILCGILRHLRNKNVFDKNILDNNDPRFSEFRKILDSKMKDLLKRGFGTAIKQAEPIMPQDEESMWEKGVFGDGSSESLQHTMFFYNCKLFGLRGHDEHHELKCRQFVLGEDSSGKYMEFIRHASKTYKGRLAKMQLTNKQIRYFSPPDTALLLITPTQLD